MKAKRAQSELINLDVLALSLLCCLLASVLCTLILGATAGENDDDNGASLDWSALHHQATRLGTQVDTLVQSRKSIVDRLNFALLQGDNERLETRVKKLEGDVDAEAKEKADLLKKIGEAEQDVTRLERKRARGKNRSEQLNRLLGDYTGPFILVECTGEGALVYPGITKFPLNPSSEQLEALVTRIADAGCVLLAVRPSAWRDQAFENLRDKIFEALEHAPPGKASILRTTFPVSDHEPLAAYLPPSADMEYEEKR